MFISEALASTGAAAAPTSGDFLTSLMPIILIFIVFYFLLLRPQQKRMKEHRNVIDNLRKGDRVVTGGGVLATVKNATHKDEVTLEISKGVEVTVVRGTIQGLWEGSAPKLEVIENKKESKK